MKVRKKENRVLLRTAIIKKKVLMDLVQPPEYALFKKRNHPRVLKPTWPAPTG